MLFDGMFCLLLTIMIYNFKNLRILEVLKMTDSIVSCLYDVVRRTSFRHKDITM